jgi:hypothetical protein
MCRGALLRVRTLRVSRFSFVRWRKRGLLKSRIIDSDTRGATRRVAVCVAGAARRGGVGKVGTLCAILDASLKLAAASKWKAAASMAMARGCAQCGQPRRLVRKCARVIAWRRPGPPTGRSGFGRIASPAELFRMGVWRLSRTSRMAPYWSGRKKS